MSHESGGWRSARLRALACLFLAGLLLAGPALTPAPVLAAPPAQLTPRTWLGTVDDNWFNCANWRDGLCPAATEVAVFNNSATRGVVISSTVVVAGLTTTYNFRQTITARAPVTVNGNVAIAGGTFIAPSQMTVNGNFEQSGSGVFTAGSGVVVLSGAGSQTLDTTQTGIFNQLAIGGPGTVTLARPVSIQGTLTLAGGTLDSAGNQISLAGHWQNNGGAFLAQNGTVRLTGGDQTLTGSNTFYNLTKTGGPGTLTFPAGLTQTVNGQLTWQGVALTTPLMLRSSSPATQWFLDTHSAAAVPVLENLNVQDSYSVISVTCTTGVDAGNNVNWIISAPATATPTATLTPTETRTPTLTSTATVTPTITLTPAPTATPTFTGTPAPTDVPSATKTPVPTNTPRPPPTFTGTLAPTPTTTPSGTPTISPTPTETLTPTQTLPPTATPLPPTPGFPYLYVTLTPPPDNAVVSVVQAMDSVGGRMLCGMWEVLVPEGSVPNGSVWHCTTLDPQVEARQKVPANHRRLWRVVNLSVTAPNGAHLRSFSPPLKICAHYSEAFFDAAGNVVARFKIYSSPDEANLWADLTAVGDPVVPRVCAPAASLSDFQLLLEKPPQRTGLASLTGSFFILTACGLLALALLALLVIRVIWLRQKKKQAPAT